MGISLSMIEKMQELRLFGSGRISVLDVGSSNLYDATALGIEDFLLTFGISPTPDVVDFSERLAQGSVFDPVRGVNNSFVGELFERAGMTYRSIDIAEGYRTTVLDLNHGALPDEFSGAFDLVMNFGTTEHLLNQYNAFHVMHDATRLGGYMVHSVPWLGYSNHGYFTYTPRCFFDLAGYNEYELTDFWFDAATAANDLYAGLRSYSGIFPKLAEFLKRDQTEVGRRIGALAIPDVGMMVVYRKVKARPFMGALEKSTSVGNVAAKITAVYGSHKVGMLDRLRAYTSGMFDGDPAKNAKAAHATQEVTEQHGETMLEAEANKLRQKNGGEAARAVTSPINRHDEIVLEGEAKKLREKFVWMRITADECMTLYRLVVQSHGIFPHDWEEKILVRQLVAEPDRADLVARLAEVRDLIRQDSSATVGLCRHEEILLEGEAEKLREQFIRMKLNTNECMRFYDLVTRSHGSFPYDWEESILMRQLVLEPDRADLATRLAEVRARSSRGAVATDAAIRPATDPGPSP